MKVNKWLGAAIVFVFGLILYWPVLSTPLIYDTLLHLRIANGLNWGNVWLPTEAFGFFRPMTFTPILFSRSVFGDDVAWFYNGMNWLQHAVNGALLFLLAKKISRRTFPALAAALVFVAFPFSYQAVMVYGHNVHPAVTGLILLGLLTSLKEGQSWKIATAFIFILGLLTHESFILFGFLGGLTKWAMGIQRRRRGLDTRRARFERFLKLGMRSSQAYAVYIVLAIVYVGVYQVLPISRAPQVEEAAGGLLTKLLYVMQGASFPLATLGKMTSLAAQPIILIAFVMTLILSVWSPPLGWSPPLRWRPNPLALVGWGWWLMASALVVLPLPTGYLLNGPRLLYLGSVGVALIWAAILGNACKIVTKESPLWRPQMAIISGVGVLLLLFSVIFVRARQMNYAELTQGIAVLETSEPDSIVLLNHPQWIAPVTNTFPLGAEFVQQLGDYLFIEEWTTQNLGIDVPTVGMRVDELLSSVPYGYGVHAQHSLGDWSPVESEWFLTRYTEDGTVFEPIGGLVTASNEVLATFGAIVLISAEFDACTQTLHTQWHNNNPAGSTTLTVFAQALDASGVLVGQNDAPPLRLRSDLLPASEYDVFDLRTIEGGAASTILLGVYDFVSGERVGAVSAEGASLADNALQISVSACRN